MLLCTHRKRQMGTCVKCEHRP